MGWKKLILGEPMPDKNDPKYKDRYEKEVATGRKVADKLHLSTPFIKAQEFANKFPAAFLAIVFGFVIICLCLNIYRMAEAYHNRPQERTTATEVQERLIRAKREAHHITIDNKPNKNDTNRQP